MTGFDLGRVVATPAALALCQEHGVDLYGLLARHASGDWGEVAASDRKANRDALKSGARLLSSYPTPGGKLWVITDGDTDACPACVAGIGECEPEQGTWVEGFHFRDDLPPRRLSTTVLLPADY